MHDLNTRDAKCFSFYCYHFYKYQAIFPPIQIGYKSNKLLFYLDFIFKPSIYCVKQLLCTSLTGIVTISKHQH